MKSCDKHKSAVVEFESGACPVCDHVGALLVENEKLELALTCANEVAHEWEMAAHEWCRTATQDPGAEVVLV